MGVTIGDNGQAGVKSLTVICSDCARNGKTLFAKLNADLLALRNGERPQIFDTDHPDGAIAHHFPDVTTIVDLRQTRQQVAVFDGILNAEDGHFVVDLAARSFRMFFDVYVDIGFADGAREAGVDTTIYYLVDRHGSSVDHLLALRERLRGTTIVPVLNHALGDPLGDPHVHNSYSRAHFDRDIRLPDLSAESLGVLEHRDFHFDEFVAGRLDNLPFEIRAELWTFLEVLYDQR